MSMTMSKEKVDVNSFDVEASPKTMQQQESTMSQEPSSPPPSGNCCCSMWRYGGISEAMGYALIAMGRGVAVMSNGTC